MTKDIRVLICGDSFAAKNTNTPNSDKGWSGILECNFTVTNLAESGVGEYKILQQIKSTKLQKFDCVIVSHTSPNRIYVKQHPLYKQSISHRNTDLIYNDVQWHLNQHPSSKFLQAASSYFIELYDQDYQEYIHRLLQKDIVDLTKDCKVLHLLTLYDQNIELFEHCINLHKQFKIVPGNSNHYSNKDNHQIYNLIKSWINEHA